MTIKDIRKIIREELYKNRGYFDHMTHPAEVQFTKFDKNSDKTPINQIYKYILNWLTNQKVPKDEAVIMIKHKLKNDKEFLNKLISLYPQYRKMNYWLNDKFEDLIDYNTNRDNQSYKISPAEVRW